ncbi:hypothetical protein [Yoonia sp. SS1-5]|uniref:Uncharacterized protein n=1 Tax=Yoonia rhodophyticola TaxID=3137370 RepID=A0AAN0M943_9RHOB
MTLTTAVLAGPARATEHQQLQTFAACAGRLSAVMEYQWMFDGVASERTKAQRATVLQLIEAVMPEDMGREVLHWRISAKLAQSALLTRATFNDDPADAAWATQTADRLTRDCTAFLLS